MAHLNSTQFSEQLSYITFQIWSYQLKDMDLDIICKKENKTEKGVGMDLDIICKKENKTDKGVGIDSARAKDAFYTTAKEPAC